MERIRLQRSHHGLFFALTACVLFLIPSAAHTQVTAIIEVFEFDFGIAATNTPVDPTINIGETVRWVWAPTNFMAHDTRSAAGQLETWDSGLHFPPFTFEHTFTHLGQFTYYCSPHGADLGGGQVVGMSGFINVVPEPSSIALACVAGAGLVWHRRSKIWLIAAGVNRLF
jgi:plastocyanin